MMQGIAWAVKLWPRNEWPFLPDVELLEDGAALVYIGDRPAAEQYLALVPVLAVLQPWGLEAHAGRAKLVMTPARVEVGEN